MKKILSIMIAAALTAALTAHAFAAQPGLGNFTYTNTYIAGQFNDVRDTDWFSQYVEDAFNYGFLRGRSNDMFDPHGLLTFGEAVTLAARLSSIYQTGKADFPASTPFYEVYAEYALQHGIIESHGDYGAPATRAQFAAIMHKALPTEAFPTINQIPGFGIPDVPTGTGISEAVYALYRAGVLTGSDDFGTFFATSNISRAEASAVVVRLADPGARVRMQLPSHIPAEAIFQRSANAVFKLEMFDDRGEPIRTGSGFFITETGLAVTALHVLNFASSATITMYNGDVYPVRGMRAYNEEHNLALIEIDSDNGSWSYLTLADSDLIEVGNTVYAIGSPRNLLNSISEGVISHPSREVDGDTLIQFTAPISFGSGGGPVLNTLGQVIGVASSSYVQGQNLNLAIPVNFVKELEPGRLMTFMERFE